ncbi:carbonate dehydratase, eukaryotictype domain containing protein [Acanthamoeba castellanii str. Neff]|uniref:Carbonic anhydrase n=1 Tax=Acanthamoeba castellanii (strain ATCC 30010 / Neff) TaxID=1257118 RepID=L8H518_ACACF|nr:carbonate dehydratase, eukaryotictype domain containing protein [Acanthamoeba castellanii str. Neff]ELR20332.1 carbonate dehydratase, eukaryotictype domain containing protein [Acanthamoeba castellanii str. Neff]
MKQARYPAILVLVLAFCFACVPGQFVEDVFGAEDINSPDEGAHIRVPRRDESDVQVWSYEGKTGPEYWASLIPAAYLCRSGMPSIISLPGYMGELQFNYSSNSRGELWNNGHSIQYRVDNSTGHSTMWGGPMKLEKYFLLQVHQHAPSEHTIDGKRYPMEMHFVHLSNDTTPHLAALSVLIEEGAASPYLDQYFHLFDYTVSKYGERHKLNAIDLQLAFPANTSYWTYKGSRTSPDCEEGFTWLVFNHPMTASRQQIEHFTNIYNKTNRCLPIPCIVVQ